MTLYECRYQWPDVSGRTPQAAATAFNRVFASTEVDDRSARVRGWYQYPGAWAGFLILDVESPEALHAWLLPYSELMTWEIRPLLSHDFTEARQQARAAAGNA
jgi:muconolactone delta-isomerase